MQKFTSPSILASFLLTVSLTGCGTPLNVFALFSVPQVHNAQSFTADVTDSNAFYACRGFEKVVVAGLTTPKLTGCSRETLPQAGNPEAFAKQEDSLRVEKSSGQLSAVQLKTLDGQTAGLLSTYTELKSLYGPIDTPAKALSFVLLQKSSRELLNQDTINAYFIPDKYHPQTTFQQISKLSKLQDNIDGTQVVAAADGGFTVKNLMVDADCPHDTAYSTDFSISRSGEIQQLAERAIFRREGCPIE